MSDLEEKLEQRRRERQWATTWEPDGPGDRLIGTFEKMDTATTDFGECRVAHVRTKDGVLKGLWLKHKVLETEWAEAAPDVGDEVGVQYLGKRDGEQFAYHVWSVVCEHTEGEGKTTDGVSAPDRPPQGPDVDEEAEDRSDSSLRDPNSELPY